MFCVVYEFEIRPGMNAQFEESWAEFTDAIYRVRGSLGSRLHKTNESQKYVAYAQWPSQEIFEATPTDDNYLDEEISARERMKESMVSSRKVYEMNVLDDRLK